MSVFVTVLTNTPISAHDHGARRALQPRVAPTPYFTCQNRIFVLVVICDQTSAPVIRVHQSLELHMNTPYIKVLECTHRFRPLMFRRSVTSSPDLLPRLRHHNTIKSDPQVEHMDIDTSPPPLIVCFSARYARASQTIRSGQQHFLT